MCSRVVRGWQVLGPYLEPFIGQEGVETLAHEYMVRCRRVVRHEQPVQVEETDEEELCNCDFSLAYGGCPPPCHCLFILQKADAGVVMVPGKARTAPPCDG